MLLEWCFSLPRSSLLAAHLRLATQASLSGNMQLYLHLPFMLPLQGKLFLLQEARPL